MTQSISSSSPIRGAIRSTVLSIALLLSGATVFASTANAQAALNLGHGLEIRLENSANHDSGTAVGQTKLVVNTLLDTDNPGPFVVTLEQGGHVLATASCEATAVVYSGERQEGEGYLRECVTNDIPSASLRTNVPADVVIALVNDATDARTELYRGTFPVIAYHWWEGNDDAGRPKHVEYRALRLDSMYGVGFVRQYMGSELEFTYVDAQHDGDIPTESSLRCKVGTGEWRAYTTSVSEGEPQRARNRVWTDAVHEDGDETIVTQFIHFTTSMPIAVRGRAHQPEGGSSMDGAWTCEMRFGGAGTRAVAREFRFDVREGYIVPHAIESQVSPGHGAVLVAVGMNPAAMPVIFDPAVVRDNVAGRHLTGATAPLVTPLPARATNPTFTMPRGGGARRGRH